MARRQARPSSFGSPERVLILAQRSLEECPGLALPLRAFLIPRVEEGQGGLIALNLGLSVGPRLFAGIGRRSHALPHASLRPCLRTGYHRSDLEASGKGRRQVD